jgi:hypothetical protein
MWMEGGSPGNGLRDRETGGGEEGVRLNRDRENARPRERDRETRRGREGRRERRECQTGKIVGQKK